MISLKCQLHLSCHKFWMQLHLSCRKSFNCHCQWHMINGNASHHRALQLARQLSWRRITVVWLAPPNNSSWLHHQQNLVQYIGHDEENQGGLIDIDVMPALNKHRTHLIKSKCRFSVNLVQMISVLSKWSQCLVQMIRSKTSPETKKRNLPHLLLSGVWPVVKNKQKAALAPQWWGFEMAQGPDWQCHSS